MLRREMNLAWTLRGDILVVGAGLQKLGKIERFVRVVAGKLRAQTIRQGIKACSGTEIALGKQDHFQPGGGAIPRGAQPRKAGAYHQYIPPQCPSLSLIHI